MPGRSPSSPRLGTWNGLYPTEATFVVRNEDSVPNNPISEFTAEFVGTFLLVYTAGVLSVVGNATWNGTAVACILMVLVYAFGPVSGGHLNPAVSLSLAVLKKFPIRKALVYVAIQIVAGILAGGSVYAAFGQSILFGPVQPYGGLSALALEFIYTAMLCFVVLSCAASTRNNPSDDQNNFFGLAIGFVIVAGGYAAGGISGASFNPAVSLGLACTSFFENILNGLLYSAVEVCGGILAALLFRILRPEDVNAMYVRENSSPGLPVRLFAEFLGTFVLVVTVGLNLVTKSEATAWSAAAALMCMVYSLEDISGAHFNPAVTIAIVSCGRHKIQPMSGALYGIVQIVAGVLAGLFYQHYQVYGAYPKEAFGLAPGSQVFGEGTVIAAELVFTFSLAFVVLACATTSLPPSPSNGHFYFALAIGSAVAAGGFAIGPISGGILNPAVAIGVATGSNIGASGAAPAPWSYGAWYAIVELLGGLLACLVFRITHVKEFQGKAY